MCPPLWPGSPSHAPVGLQSEMNSGPHFLQVRFKPFRTRLAHFLHRVKLSPLSPLIPSQDHGSALSMGGGGDSREPTYMHGHVSVRTGPSCLLCQ